MSGYGGEYATPLQGNTPDAFGELQKYNNVLKTQAEIPFVQAQTAFTQEQAGTQKEETTSKQLANALARVQLQLQQYRVGVATSPTNPNEQPPGGPGAAAESSSYAAPTEQQAARYATATPPPQNYASIVDTAAAKYNVPSWVGTWVGSHESNWDPNATGPQTSSGKAGGAWQFMGKTAEAYGLKDPHDFASSTDAAMHYLSDLYKKTGDWGEAVRLYGTFSTGRGKAWDQAAEQGFRTYAKQHTATAGATPPPAAEQPPPVTPAPARSAAVTPPPDNALAALAARVPAGMVGEAQTGPEPQKQAVVPQQNQLSLSGQQQQQQVPQTSSQGLISPIFGGQPMPKYLVASIPIGTPGEGKAIADAMQLKRDTIAQTASGATDAASWNAGVLNLWRGGWISTPQYQQWTGQYSPEMRDHVVRQMGSPESQAAAANEARSRGMILTPGGAVLDPTSYAATHPREEIYTKNPDGSFTKVGVPAVGVAGAGGARVQGQPAPAPGTAGGAGGGGGVQPPPGGTGGDTATPLPAGATVLSKPELDPAAQKRLDVQTEGQKGVIASVTQAVTDDGKEVAENQAGAMQSQRSIPTILDLRQRVAAMPDAAFGPGADGWRMALTSAMNSFSPQAANDLTAWITQHKIDPNNVAQMQALRKEFFGMVTAAESQNPGTRMGAMLTNYFSKAMPNLTMSKPAIQDMLNVVLVGAQMARDYATQSADHYNKNSQAWTNAGGDPTKYQRLSVFNDAWTTSTAANAPQVYEAAARLMNGGKKEIFAGLNDAQKKMVFTIADRVEPGISWSDDQMPSFSAQK